MNRILYYYRVSIYNNSADAVIVTKCCGVENNNWMFYVLLLH